MSEDLHRFMKLTFEVSQLSDNDIVRGWMRHIKLSKSLKLEILLSGAIQLPEREIHLDNGITLKPHPHEWQGRKMISSSIEESFKICELLNQMYRGEFLVEGWINVENDQKETLENALKEINTTVNILSFHANSKLTWEPIHKFVSKGISSCIYSNKEVEDVNNLIERIRKMPSSDITEDVFRSLDWYRTGLYSPSKFNQFLSFWRCIEILIDTWNRTIHPEHYHKRGDKKGERKYIVNGIRILLKDIAKIAFDILLKDDPDKDIIYSKCFQNSDSEKSWSWIRNKIAHGRIYEGSIGQKYCDEKTIYNIREIAKKLILKSISLNLEQNLH